MVIRASELCILAGPVLALLDTLIIFRVQKLRRYRMLQQTRQPTSQAGFTLVELAIVMIIIGLLIAGVLKGQELIGNARVTTTVAQIKSIDAATSTFKDTYAGIPGDLTTPGTRVPNCTGDCDATPGNGDGVLGTAAAPATFAAAPTGETVGFFPQLAAAGLITGIVPGTATFGGDYPQAKIDATGIIPGSITATTAAQMPAAAGYLGAPTGLYLSLTNAVAASAAGTTPLKPSEASRIDIKLDDGVPGSGSVISFELVNRPLENKK
jgi:prepilin-type N-terminal cleavage/methylation domain-containing protein